ncbi:helix-turn-helix domain-containing protein [Amycolatopsis sp. NPDC059021]|uniref:helix-turn-helix domain-containing protein n=1 Tax=Amycolatopsis sp. NPDC059021 TaxID=3346704 RepID=UPI00366D2A41
MTLLLHPVRLRIVQAVADEQVFTTAQLCDRLPDVSRATVYRQLALLAEGGLVEVAGEQRIRGAVERSYRLRRGHAVIPAEDAARMTADEHRRGLAAVVASLLAEFDVYLGREGADPFADGVSYKQFSLWLDEDERASLTEEVRAAIAARAGNRPRKGRTRHLLAPIFFPAEPGPPS